MKKINVILFGGMIFLFCIFFIIVPSYNLVKPKYYNLTFIAYGFNKANHPVEIHKLPAWTAYLSALPIPQEIKIKFFDTIENLPPEELQIINSSHTNAEGKIVFFLPKGFYFITEGQGIGPVWSILLNSNITIESPTGY